jgi:acyl carrier protein
MDEREIRASLRSWIAEHSKVPIHGELADSTPILDQGILSSLDVVEFVLFIESLRGDEVDTDALEPETFTSVDTIYEGFFGAPS